MRKLYPCFLALVVPAAAWCGYTGTPSKGAAPGAAHASSDGYAVVKTLAVGGEGRWDYALADPASKRLYVTRQTHVQVIATDTGEVTGDIKETPGCHGVALAPDVNRGFVSNGQDNSVTVFDLKTLHALVKVKTGQNPDAILYDPASKKVLAFNGKSQDATAFEANGDLTALAMPDSTTRIPLEGKPEFAAADGQGRVFVNIEDKNVVTVIDTKSMKVADTWKIEGGEEPSGMAIDNEHHRLFLGCGNQVMAILDSQSGKTLGTVPIGKGVDACGFDPGTGEAFASCGDGTLTVVKETSPGKFEVAQTVQTRQGARTMALDPATHTVYLPTAEFEPAKPGERRPAPKAGSFMLVVVAKAAK